MSRSKRKFWSRLFLSHIVVTLIPLLIAANVAVTLIHTQIEEQAKITLDKNLDAASRFFFQRLGHIHFHLNTVAEFLGSDLYTGGENGDLQELLKEIKERDDLSFLTVITPTGQVIARANSELRGDMLDSGCEAASFKGSCFKGVTILDCVFLEKENLVAQAFIYNVPKEYADVNKEGKRGIALAATVPIRNSEGEVKAYLLGGELLNNNLRLVDQIEENWQGNATIFLNNLRVATTVRINNGERAMGTILSPEVAEIVLEEGQRYLGRSTIIDTMYLTAYEPLFNASGDVIGAIFLGLPEEPYLQIKRETVTYFFAVALFGVLLAGLISYFIMRSIQGPLEKISQAMRKVQSGDFSHRFKD